MIKAITIKMKSDDKVITAEDVAEAFIDCVKEGRLESNAALWYLDLIHDLFITNHEIAAVNVLSCVLHHADSPICCELEELFKRFVKNERYLVNFLDDFLGYDEIDDYLLELELLKLSRNCLRETHGEEADE